MKMNHLATVCTFLAILFAIPAFSLDPASVKTSLLAYLDGKLPEEKFHIEYNDIRASRVGEVITLDGSGYYYRKLVESDGKATESRNNISRLEVEKVVNILLEIEASVQKKPAASPVPAETRATLKIRIGSDTTEIWERYTELLQNHRVGRIKDAMRVIGERK